MHKFPTSFDEEKILDCHQQNQTRNIYEFPLSFSIHILVSLRLQFCHVKHKIKFQAARTI